MALGHIKPCSYAGWRRDDQRHVDVCVERGLLAGMQPVLAHVVAVVRAEHEIGVLGQALGLQLMLDTADHVVDRQIGLDSLLLVLRARSPVFLGARERLVALQPE